MEAWSVARYRRPFLQVDSIYVDPSTQRPVLVARGRQYQIDRSDGGPVEGIASRLEALRSPDAPQWRELLDPAAAPPAWTELIQQIDHLALLKDAGGSPRNYLEAELAHASRLATDLGDQVLRLVLPERREALRRNAELLLKHLGALVHEYVREEAPECRLEIQGGPTSLEPGDPLAERNFFLLTLMLQARYWRRHAPLALICAHRAVERLCDLLRPGRQPRRPGSERVWSDLLEDLLGGIYSQRDLLAHLKSLGDLLVWSVDPDAERACQVHERSSGPVSGINFLLHAENAVVEALRQLGQPRYLETLEAGNLSTRLAQGCYIEEFHVTCRFNEIIAALLPKRLDERVRRRTFGYYQEEYGHEALELETVRRLGVREAALKNALPLPLHVAFVDLFTYLAETHPVSYLTSIFLTEGLPGAPSHISQMLRKHPAYRERFGEVTSEHDAINVKLNHQSLSRLMMADLEVISPRTQDRALRLLLHLVELNHRAWNHLHDYYADETKPLYHGWYGGTIPH